ncbi:MAG: hypothetical protein PHF61_08455 [Bacteroidales bacterium]|nr:hypothetical protein [Bacteroidales bacterium]
MEKDFYFVFDGPVPDKLSLIQNSSEKMSLESEKPPPGFLQGLAGLVK